jgi:hypothetical protein
MNKLQDYWDALERIRQGKSSRVPKGSAINNDSVALEAGRNRGAIKKSRKSHKALIDAINELAQCSSLPSSSDGCKVKLEREKARNYRELYHQALNRELMLVERLAQLENELDRFKNIIPFGK